ncbi:hypothetical protein [Nocardioides sp. 616]|uniref:lipopolysaccharide biosynthesis protein n=1 Tax=Nocardioides sp. 616 TaxID=2268090 RepID=UPI0013B3CE07|nr:hypothetical protein [Nocardioides sp. 616]
MADPNAEPRLARGRGAGSAALVGVASLFSAVVTYLVMWMGARFLSTADTTYLLTFLSVLFATYGVLAGVSTETTRSVAASLRDEHAPGPRTWAVALAVAVLSSLVVLGLAAAWQDEVLHFSAPALVWALTAGVFGYAFHSVLVGALSGNGSWDVCAAGLAGEAGVRLLVSLGVVWAGASVVPLAAASVAGSFAWVILWCVSPRGRDALRLRTDCLAPVLARRMSVSAVAQAANSMLVVGFPVLLAATTATSDYRLGAPLLLAISLTRAPILIPLNAYQGLAVSSLVHSGAGVGSTLKRLLVLVGGVALVGAFLAWAVGPWLMTTLFGADYEVAGWVLAGLTVGAAFTAGLTLTGATAQALAAHQWFLAGWLTALVLAVGVLLLPGSMEVRAIAAMLVGPAGGLLVHVAGFRRRIRLGNAIEQDGRP